MLRPGTDTGKTGTNGNALPGFLSTIVQLCAGTEVLTRIYKTSPGRAVWRFFLLTILCAVLAAIIGTVILRGPFSRTGQALDEEIGAFEFSPQKISLAKAPDTPRHLRLSGAVLEYFPGDTFTREDFNAERTTDFGFTILSRGMACWMTDPVLNRNGEDIYIVLFLSASELYADASVSDDQTMLYQMELLPGPEFAKKLRDKFGSRTEHAETAESEETAGNGETAEPGKIAENKVKQEQPVRITGSQIIRKVLETITALILLKTFFRNFAGIGLIILLVSLIQYLRASTLPKGISYKNVLTIMIYSTFPAQIAATLLDAAGLDSYLPLLTFNLLFVCIFFVYQIFAFRAVMRKVCPQNDRKDDDFSDSDF